MLGTSKLRKKKNVWNMRAVLVALIVCALCACGKQQRPEYPCTWDTLKASDEEALKPSDELSENVWLLFVDPTTQDLQTIRQEEALELIEEGGILENVVMEGTDPTTGRSVSVPLKDALVARDCDDCLRERLAQCESTPIPPLAEECCHCLLLWLLGDPCFSIIPPAIKGCDVFFYWLIDGKLYGPYCGHYA